jgi:hypothetical protein
MGDVGVHLPRRYGFEFQKAHSVADIFRKLIVAACIFICSLPKEFFRPLIRQVMLDNLCRISDRHVCPPNNDRKIIPAMKPRPALEPQWK